MVDTTAQILDNFISRYALPEFFREIAVQHYLPCMEKLVYARPPADSGKPFVLGVNGAQGSGKSTFAECIAALARGTKRWNVAVLSIDDIYLTKQSRQALARQVHPLFATRGVPGTHDVELGLKTLEQLTQLSPGQRMALPRFDKAVDDRAEASRWPVVEGPLDLIIFEGWCVGALPQDEQELEQPVNDLESSEDHAGIWRAYVNQQLADVYPALWAELDSLVMLKVPSFSCVANWRWQQEQRLLERCLQSGEDASSVMSHAGVMRFIQHYQRITEHNLRCLPSHADALFELDEAHMIAATRYRN